MLQPPPGSALLRDVRNRCFFRRCSALAGHLCFYVARNPDLADVETDVSIGVVEDTVDGFEALRGDEDGVGKP
jgi:hypothetical protein